MLNYECYQQESLSASSILATLKHAIAIYHQEQEQTNQQVNSDVNNNSSEVQRQKITIQKLIAQIINLQNLSTITNDIADSSYTTTYLTVIEQILSSQRISCGRFRDTVGAKLTALRSPLSSLTAAVTTGSQYLF